MHIVSFSGVSCALGIDVDPAALHDALENESSLVSGAEFLLGDVHQLHLARKVDTVVMNPPFGTRHRGADVLFLKKAIEVGQVSALFSRSRSLAHFFLLIIDCGLFLLLVDSSIVQAVE